MLNTQLAMTEGEILREYSSALNKKRQIGILADLNAVPRKEIIKLLQRQGVDINNNGVKPHMLPLSQREAELLMEIIQRTQRKCYREIERGNTSDTMREIGEILNAILRKMEGLNL